LLEHEVKIYRKVIGIFSPNLMMCIWDFCIHSRRRSNDFGMQDFDFAQILPKFAQILGKFTQILDKFTQISPKFYPNLPRFCVSLPKFWISLLKFHPNFTQICPPKNLLGDAAASSALPAPTELFVLQSKTVELFSTHTKHKLFLRMLILEQKIQIKYSEQVLSITMKVF